jgi:hypothetical protein
MTPHSKTPQDPDPAAQPTAAMSLAQRLAEEEDRREVQDPYDLPYPGDCDRWRGRPEYVIVIDRVRTWQPSGPPSLAEVLETGRAPKPEPDLEAEP